MIKLKGSGVSPGIAVGKIFFMEKADEKIIRRTVNDTQAELDRLSNAVEDYLDDLTELKIKTQKEAGEESSQIFETHSLILRDPDLRGEPANR